MRIEKLVPDSGSTQESWDCAIEGAGFEVLVYRDLSCGFPYGIEGEDRFEVTIIPLDESEASAVSLGNATWQSEKELRVIIPAGLPPGIYDVRLKSPLGEVATKRAGLTIIEGDTGGTDSSGTDSQETDSDDIDEYLDNGFGENGRFSSASDMQIHTPSDAVTAPDGAIFIAGSVEGGTNQDLMLLKLTADGMLDTTFDTKGYITRDNIAGGNGDDAGTGIVLAPDGDLLVCGHSQTGDGRQQGFLWKVSTAGVSDTSFGAAGTYLFDPDHRVVRAKYDSHTGNIFAVGTFGGNVHVFRVLAGGSGLDPKFNGGAPVTLYPASTQNATLKPLDDGSLLVAGQCLVDTHYYRACSWRIGTQGAIKIGYTNYEGQALVHFGTTKAGDFGLWNDVITPLDTDTRIILAGSREIVQNNPDEVLAMVHPFDGSFDSSFGGGDGIWTQDLLGVEDVGKVTSALALEDGTILVASKVTTATKSSDVAIIRLDSKGVRDTGFTSKNGILSLGVDYQDINPKLILHSEHRVLVLSSEQRTDPGDIVIWAIAL